jgi:hypothetical protein
MARNSKTATASASIEAIASVSNVPVVIDTSWEDMGAFDYAASIDIGKATSEHIAALKVTARDDEKLLAVQKRYYVGAFAKGCDVAREVAVARLALASSKHKTATDKRTDAEDLIYQAAKTTWSRACDKAGLPQIKIGGNGPRGPKAGTPEEPSKPVSIDQIIVPTGLTAQLLMEFFAKLQTTFERAVEVNRKTACTGTVGPLFDKANNDMLAYVGDMKARIGMDKVTDANATTEAAARINAAKAVKADATKDMLANLKAELMAQLKAELLSKAA